MNVGLLHPGEMGAAIGAVLREHGHGVLWASSGRSQDTARRAEAAGLEDAGTVAELAERAELILSVCPPHAAQDVARAVSDLGFAGVFVDANAVAPATVREIAGLIEQGGGTFVDGGLVGSPPSSDPTHLYLSGAEAASVVDLFEGTLVDARIISDEPGDASALKMVYAAWSKGTAALVLAIRAVARAEGVEETLLQEWDESLPDLAGRSERAARSAGSKGWRWVGEMEEIAATFADAGLPDGFHRAAAEVFRRSPRLTDPENALERVLAELGTRPG